MKYLIICIFLSIPFSAFNQNTSFADWDRDGDQVIERFEFASKFVTDIFTDWERQSDQGIVEEGFFKESYAGLDTDNDNMLSDEEWLVGYNYFYDHYLLYQGMRWYDANQDGMISYDEYYDALYDTSFFEDIDVDADDYISEYELAYYVFDNWDYDDSETLSRSEFNRFDWYYLDI